MFTKADINYINATGFQILHADSNRITLVSGCGHQWHLIARTMRGYDTCEVYHRHAETDPWHIQFTAKGLKTAIVDIMSHDEYQKRKDRIRDKRRALAKARRQKRVAAEK